MIDDAFGQKMRDIFASHPRVGPVGLKCPRFDLFVHVVQRRRRRIHQQIRVQTGERALADLNTPPQQRTCGRGQREIFHFRSDKPLPLRVTVQQRLQRWRPLFEVVLVTLMFVPGFTGFPGSK